MKNFFALLSSLILTTFYTNADYQFPVTLSDVPSGSNQLHLEPKVSQTTFSTSNLKQTGQLYGLKGGYDMLIYGAPYFGFETYYMRGTLKDNLVESTYEDTLFEGKAGYTLGYPDIYFITPYFGFGYEKEKNNYTTTPVDKLSYYAVSLGLLSNFYFNENSSIGFNIKFKFPVHGNQDIKKDEIVTRISVSKKAQYFIELPISYTLETSSIALMPFYEYKKYGANSGGDNWLKSASISQYGVKLKICGAF